MKSNYEDILSLTNKKPLWYDQNGCPRFVEFHPSLSPNIYASNVVLLEIACQACDHTFYVEMNCSTFDGDNFAERCWRFLKDKKYPMWSPLHYGDPPIHGCVGDTENCNDLQILQFWKKDYNRGLDDKWVRDTQYEFKFSKTVENE